MNSTLQKYAIDPSHTSVEFLVRHMMLAKVRGRFTGVTGSFAVPDQGTMPTEIEVQIAASTIDTREEQRDTHLKSADFLDVEHFASIDFKSTQVEGSGEKFRLHGVLSIHGVSRPVVLEAAFEGRATDPWGNARIGFTAQTTIGRKDFGLTWNQALETGGLLVGDEVRIELNVEGIAQK
ncbi:MAG: YceI family protein [Candidatus Eremiobacteraeota bacterium]|uniref:YceI n=1 Tax=mine drainage metagenome TaxID=410659 RepID=E6PEF2_9ZZZZ|nr:YceI family protein [Candidatus Eremiobacteraeota bacterium]